MSGLAPHFAPGTPYESWQLHACGEPTGLAPLRSLLAMPVSELDGGERQPYAERMEGCARCWAETNTEDTLLAPPFGSPYPPGSRAGPRAPRKAPNAAARCSASHPARSTA